HIGMVAAHPVDLVVLEIGGGVISAAIRHLELVDDLVIGGDGRRRERHGERQSRIGDGFHGSSLGRVVMAPAYRSDRPRRLESASPSGEVPRPERRAGPPPPRY